jgi:REP element-mobilizing transposase RayT
VTLCLEPRLAILAGNTAHQIAAAAHAMTTDGTWELRALTIMPDHVHLFFTLGERLTLSQAIGRLKTQTKSLLKTHNADWQDNFYDHQLRPDDSTEATVRYIFQNAIHAGLISRDQRWPYFYCCTADWAWFETLTDSGQPFPEWLM